MASDKKVTDKIKVDDTSNLYGKINVGNIDISKTSISSTSESSNVEMFIRGLRVISFRHTEKRGWILQLLHDIFQGRKEIEKVSNILELKDLIQILTVKDFYETTLTAKQQKYIRIMLNYLVREIPQDYEFLLEGFFPGEKIAGNIYGTDVIAELITQRLAGDTTTDAPSPVGDVKKKKRKGR